MAMRWARAMESRQACKVIGSSVHLVTSRTMSPWVLAEWIQSVLRRCAGSAGPEPPSTMTGIRSAIAL